MHIVAGIRKDSDEATIQELAKAGADEFFLGFVPEYWSREFGYELSPNRRYFSGAQITDPSHLKRLCAAATDSGRAVALTFNEHIHTTATWNLGQRLLDDAVGAGISAIIVADPLLVPEMAGRYPGISLHLSGDAGVYNSAAAEELCNQGISRIIFPRELEAPEMASIISATNAKDREFEAFVMGEPCVYDGARCFTEHGFDFGCDFCNDHQMKIVRSRHGGQARPLEPPQEAALQDPSARQAWTLGKCGLCALPTLEKIGITHCKVPGRSSIAGPAIALVRRMLDAPDAGPDLARSLLGAPALCAGGHFCYYPELNND